MVFHHHHNVRIVLHELADDVVNSITSDHDVTPFERVVFQKDSNAFPTLEDILGPCAVENQGLVGEFLLQALDQVLRSRNQGITPVTGIVISSRRPSVSGPFGVG